MIWTGKRRCVDFEVGQNGGASDVEGCGKGEKRGALFDVGGGGGYIFKGDEVSRVW